MSATADLEHTVGKYCELKTCGRKDFLPMRCSNCLEWFCSDHIQPESHSCGKTAILRTHICPNCVFSVSTSDDHEGVSALAEHQKRGCLKKNSENQCTFKSPKSGKQCPKIELVPVVCPFCKARFCFRHRSERVHDCEAWKQQQAEKKEKAKKKGKVVSKKGREQLSLKSLMVTQNGVAHPQKLLPLATYVHEGGLFNRAWAKGARDAIMMTANAVQMTGELYPIHVWLINGVHYIWRGHHFALAIWLGGRDYLEPSEYIVRKSTIDVTKVNLSYGYLVPFDPETHLRTCNFGQLKRDIREKLRNSISSGSTQDVEAYVVAHIEDYTVERGGIKSIQDLLTSISESLNIQLERMVQQPESLD
mmetsp:Transcript_8859/g.13449  ORF Transcript_8859/g.13449 Transcript_8859/m.13449 type:complete len:362 (+) Transcript_8859:105-1190(+)